MLLVICSIFHAASPTSEAHPRIAPRMSSMLRSALFAGIVGVAVIGNAIPAMADDKDFASAIVPEDRIQVDESLNDSFASYLNTPASDVPDNFVSTLVNFNSSLCLAIGSASAEPGKAAIQWTCGSGGKSGNPEQKWRFAKKVDGYEIVNGSSGLCLTIAGGKTDNAVPAVQLPCKGGLEQRWIFREDSLNLMNARTKKCLAIGSAKKDRGLGAIQWPCNSNPAGNPEQEWIISEESEFPSSDSEPEPSDETAQGPDTSIDSSPETHQDPDTSVDSSPGPDTSADLLLEGTDSSPDADQGPDTTTDSSPETDQSPDIVTEPSQAAVSSSTSGAARTSAVSVPRRSDGYKTLILLHGFTVTGSVNCDKYWGNGKVEKYLNNKRGWAGKVKKLTFYWSGGKGCTRIPGSGGTGHAIEDLGSAFAWYIYNTYSRHGVPVDVIAHSMGGLVTRTAITGTQKRWKTASGRTFPPYLYIEDVATLSSPHEGARASVWGGCSKSRFQVCEMIPGSSFLRSWIAPYGNPQSKMGTDWSFIGSGADWVVNTGSALNTKASRHPGHKYLFLSGSGLDHAQMANITEDGRRFNYPIKYCHYYASCNKANWDRWPQIPKGAGPLWVAANAVFLGSW